MNSLCFIFWQKLFLSCSIFALNLSYWVLFNSLILTYFIFFRRANYLKNLDENGKRCKKDKADDLNIKKACYLGNVQFGVAYAENQPKTTTKYYTALRGWYGY